MFVSAGKIYIKFSRNLPGHNVKLFFFIITGTLQLYKAIVEKIYFVKFVQKALLLKDRAYFCAGAQKKKKNRHPSPNRTANLNQTVTLAPTLKLVQYKCPFLCSLLSYSF